MRRVSSWVRALAECEESCEPSVIVTVVRDQGSTPREAGTKMLVRENSIAGTIGGGHLELSAMNIAREMLRGQVKSLRVRRFSLGPSLGQCCGGVTMILFEPLGYMSMQVAVFGAGHVARALVPLLATLPCKVQWIDSRAHEFPAVIPQGVQAVIEEDPADRVKTMPPGAYYLVMTHSHALDFELVAASLARGDAAYVGVIGSKTKRAKFAQRLEARSFSTSTVSELHCPIGLPEVKGKLPAEIAISVAAQLIAHYQSSHDEAEAVADDDEESRDLWKAMAAERD